MSAEAVIAALLGIITMVLFGARRSGPRRIDRAVRELREEDRAERMRIKTERARKLAELEEERRRIARADAADLADMLNEKRR